MKKAFDSVSPAAGLVSLKAQGIEEAYVRFLDEIYKVRIILHKKSEKFPIRKGVGQGDSISPKLFTACLDEIFRELDWEKGILEPFEVCGRYCLAQ